MSGITVRWFGAKSDASELHSINPFCEYQRGSQHFPKLLTKQRARCIKQHFNSNASRTSSRNGDPFRKMIARRRLLIKNPALAG
jgi:hypothetical protein